METDGLQRKGTNVKKDGGLTVITGREEFGSSALHTLVALGLWLGTIHFNVVLVLFTLFFLPLSKALVFVPLSPFDTPNQQIFIFF